LTTFSISPPIFKNLQCAPTKVSKFFVMTNPLVISVRSDRKGLTCSACDFFVTSFSVLPSVRRSQWRKQYTTGKIKIQTPGKVRLLRDSFHPAIYLSKWCEFLKIRCNIKKVVKLWGELIVFSHLNNFKFKTLITEDFYPYHIVPCHTFIMYQYVQC